MGEEEGGLSRRLADVAAVRQLKARYFRCLDRKDWDGMADVFTADAVMDMRSDVAMLAAAGLPVDPDDGLIVGRDSIVSSMRGPMDGTISVHHGHMPEIDVAGEDEATGIWAMEDIVRLPDGAPFRRLHGYGHYHESYARGEDGRWRISHLRLSRLHCELD